jgi:hypothetical protein
MGKGFKSKKGRRDVIVWLMNLPLDFSSMNYVKNKEIIVWLHLFREN